MRRCPRAFCGACDQEMIHRDNRKSHESASALGQIVWRLQRLGYRGFTIGDIDLSIRRGSRRTGRTLLRLVEQKQPGHKFEEPQQQTLHDLDVVIRHAVGCHVSGLARDATALDPGSGVFVLRADIGEKPGLTQRATGFRSDVTVERPSGEVLLEGMSSMDALAWLIEMSGERGLRWHPDRHLWIPTEVA